MVSPIVTQRILNYRDRNGKNRPDQKSRRATNSFSLGGSQNGRGSGRGSFRRFEKINVWDITYDEVTNVYECFQPKLKLSQESTKVVENNFCTFSLVQQDDDRPPELFGRVLSLYPGAGNIERVRQMELLFPRFDQSPGLVTLKGATEISPDTPERPPESYSVRAQFFANDEDEQELRGQGGLFREHGFEPEFLSSHDNLFYFHTLEEADMMEMPWVIVVGSRWLSELNKDEYPVVTSNLFNLLMLNRVIINYRPERVMPLKKIINIKAHPDLFEEVETPDDVLDAVDRKFWEMFMYPVQYIAL